MVDMNLMLENIMIQLKTHYLVVRKKEKVKTHLSRARKEESKESLEELQML